MGNLSWSEGTISRLIKEKRGVGSKEEYKPWLDVRSVSSRGVTNRVVGRTVPRMYTFLSNEEYLFFLLADNAHAKAEDIREQFPLKRELTLQAAREASVAHPKYPGGSVDMVMTLDMLIIRGVGKNSKVFGVNCKPAHFLELAREMEKMEIMRRTCLVLGIQLLAVSPLLLDTARARNLEWMYSGDSYAGLSGLDVEEHAEVVAWYRREFALESSIQLSKFSSNFEHNHRLPGGLGLDIAKFLLRSGELVTPMNTPGIAHRPISDFQLLARRYPSRPKGV